MCCLKHGACSARNTPSALSDWYRTVEEGAANHDEQTGQVHERRERAVHDDRPDDQPQAADDADDGPEIHVQPFVSCPGWRTGSGSRYGRPASVSVRPCPERSPPGCTTARPGYDEAPATASEVCR